MGLHNITSINDLIISLAAHGWLPMNDEKYLKLRFKKTTGKTLNINIPVTFNEKLQWLKIHDRKPLYTTMVDKYEAKKYVGRIIGEDHIIPGYGVWNRFDDIDFNTLPNQFVLKCTHDSGGLVICKDKRDFDIKYAKNKISQSLKRRYFYQGREWPYKNVKPRIIAEKYVQDNMNSKETNVVDGLTDYKFYCFNGKPMYLYISRGLDNHSTAQISFLNLDWTFAPFGRSDYLPFDELPQKPSRFDEMIEYATRLSNGIPFLRVDLYQIDDKVYFSELTFSPCGGMMPFQPEEYDLELGKMLDLGMARDYESK